MEAIVSVPPETVAVRTTLCPIEAGLVAEISAVLVARALTFCANAADVLGALRLSPEYTALRLWPPAVAKVAA